MLLPKLQALVYDILPSITAVFSYAIGPRKLSANEQFFVGAQTVANLLQTTQSISDVCFMLPCCLRQLRQNQICLNRDRTPFFFFTRGGCISCLRGCLGARLLPQSYYNPNLSESADCTGGQLRGDEECPFSGITNPGRVWRKVPESNARSIVVTCTIGLRILMSQGIFTPCFTSVSSVGQHQIIHGIDRTWHRQID